MFDTRQRVPIQITHSKHPGLVGPAVLHWRSETHVKFSLGKYDFKLKLGDISYETYNCDEGSDSDQGVGRND